jgi:DNA-binding transcriptional ArsR family regulator
LEPIGVRFKFEEKKVSMTTYELPDEELMEENNTPVRDRILAALKLEAATNKELQELTGASQGTLRNKLSELMGEGLLTADEGRPKKYSLVSSSPTMYIGSDSDDTSNPTVSGLFANPPGWLTSQLKVYRRDPERHFRPLCAAVAAVILEDDARWEEVQEEVERELGSGGATS